MKRDYAQYLLKKTREDYNLIAEDFSSSRNTLWPELNVFGKYIENGDKVLDLGCGNGRLSELFKDKNIDYLGADNSEKLIKIAKAKYPNSRFQLADALNLPFPDNYFDKIISVAVLHHIPSEILRLKFLQEARRILKPGGLLILTVWDLWQSPKTFFLIIEFALLRIFNRSKLDFKDVFIPWQKKIDRYIHCFTKGELKKIAEKVGMKVKETGTLKAKGARNYNTFIVAEKRESPYFVIQSKGI